MIAALGLVVGKEINLAAVHLLGQLMLAIFAVIVFQLKLIFRIDCLILLSLSLAPVLEHSFLG